MQGFNLGFCTLIFDDANGTAVAYKNLDPDLIHDFVGEELEDDEDES